MANSLLSLNDTIMEKSSQNLNFESNFSFNMPCNGSCNTTMTTKPGMPPQLITLEYIGYVLQPLILILGLTGNTFNVIIINSKQFSHVTSRYFLTALSLSDTITLLTQIFNKAFIIKLFGIDIRALSDVGCKIFWFTFRTSKMVSSWFVVFICIDRFIAVKFPLKAKRLSTKRLALIEIASALAVLGVLDAYWSYASKIVNGRCHPDAYDKTNKDDVKKFTGLLTTGSSLCFLMPMVIMGILTPLIIQQLYTQRKNRKQLSSKKVKNNKDAKISFMLVGITTAFFILVTPGVLMHNIALYMGVHTFGKNITEFLIFKEIAQILEQINYAINFFLYILTSSQFRKGFVRLIRCQNTSLQRASTTTFSKRMSSAVWHSNTSTKSTSIRSQ